ncbi:Coiled-coil domain-containing protein 137 [Aix galericulata]|nr:Coiled-coil domain-containing protein 137 [Aix galericulata]
MEPPDPPVQPPDPPRPLPVHPRRPSLPQAPPPSPLNPAPSSPAPFKPRPRSPPGAPPPGRAPPAPPAATSRRRSPPTAPPLPPLSGSPGDQWQLGLPVPPANQSAAAGSGQWESGGRDRGGREPGSGGGARPPDAEPRGHEEPQIQEEAGGRWGTGGLRAMARHGVCPPRGPPSPSRPPLSALNPLPVSLAGKQQQPKPPAAHGDIVVPKFKRGKGESEHSYICRMEQEVQRILFLTKNQAQREPEKEAAAPQNTGLCRRPVLREGVEGSGVSAPRPEPLQAALGPGRGGESCRAPVFGEIWGDLVPYPLRCPLESPAANRAFPQVSEEEAGQSPEEEGGEARGFAGEEPAPRWGWAGTGGTGGRRERAAAAPPSLTPGSASPSDTVAFGEVVTEPPTLTSRPRRGGPAEQVSCRTRPKAPAPWPCPPVAFGPPDLPRLCPQAGCKRLLLAPRLAPVSLARQRIVQEERARVVQAYRDIQRRKRQQREAQAARGVPG